MDKADMLRLVDDMTPQEYENLTGMKKEGVTQMKAASHEPLDKEQTTYHKQLLVAVEQINQADELMGKAAGPEAAEQNARAATALVLSAMARIQVLEAASKYNMVARLTQFAKQPRA